MSETNGQDRLKTVLILKEVVRGLETGELEVAAGLTMGLEDGSLILVNYFLKKVREPEPRFAVVER